MRRLRIAYAMINCNRRDGSARALNELAERIALNHDVHLFARRAEEIDLSHMKWHKMPGLSWPAVLDFTSYHLLAKLAIRAGDFDIIPTTLPSPDPKSRTPVGRTDKSSSTSNALARDCPTRPGSMSNLAVKEKVDS